jgi:phage FluMu protein Com
MASSSIEFPCPSCKKILNTDHIKAGIRSDNRFNPTGNYNEFFIDCPHCNQLMQLNLNNKTSSSADKLLGYIEDKIFDYDEGPNRCRRQ